MAEVSKSKVSGNGFEPTAAATSPLEPQEQQPYKVKNHNNHDDIWDVFERLLSIN